MTWLTAQQIRYHARAKWDYAKAMGLVAQADTQKCIDCGEQATEYDHRDYRRYMDVEPICGKCNAGREQAFPRLDGNEMAYVEWYMNDNINKGKRPQFHLGERCSTALTKIATDFGVSETDAVKILIRRAAKLAKVWA